jgi:hypothetical protein
MNFDFEIRRWATNFLVFCIRMDKKAKIDLEFGLKWYGKTTDEKFDMYLKSINL